MLNPETCCPKFHLEDIHHQRGGNDQNKKYGNAAKE